MDKTYQHLAFAADGHVQHIYAQIGSRSWAHTDLAVAAGAPPALGAAGR